MKSFRYIILALLVSLAGTAFTLWYGNSHSKVPRPLVAPKVSSDIPPLVTTALPGRHTFTLSIPWIGAVESRASAGLTAAMAGRIESIEVQDQGRIRKGRLVMRLGGPQVDGTRAGLAAGIGSFRSQIALARRTVERVQRNLDAQLATRDRLAAAEDAEIRLEVQLRQAQLKRKTFEEQVLIRAPIDGVFTNRRVSPGQDVQAGQVLGDVVDPGRLRIAASLFPPPGVRLEGKKATVRMSEGRPLAGIVRRVLPQASQTGAVTVWIESRRIDALLRPGQSAAGSLIVKVDSDALAVPKSAIVYDSGEHPFVFVTRNGTYAPLAIRLGLEQDGWVEVLAGLEPDQPVATQGAYELFYRRFNEQFQAED